ncbi:MAG: enoyl-CoA hydratase/isomerase family protein, partial [Burkholderiaceae bacterium]
NMPPAGVLALASVKRAGPRVGGNDSASLWDLGDGVLGLEIHTKMNACNGAVIEAVEAAAETVARGFRALVVGNDHARAFSAGADLAFFVDMIERRQWQALEQFVARGQEAFLRLKYAPFPAVAAAFGLTLGGGCELMMHCDATFAHAELNAGFPELNVGIVPGWGGCTQLVLRMADRADGVQRTFETVAGATVSSSALAAHGMGILRAGDGIVFNRDRLLAAARDDAVAMSQRGYIPPPKASVTLGATSAAALLEAAQSWRAERRLSDNDWAVIAELAGIFGGDGSAPRAFGEAELTRLEREAFLRLAQRPATLERMKHMLATGKPLRN